MKSFGDSMFAGRQGQARERLETRHGAGRQRDQRLVSRPRAYRSRCRGAARSRSAAGRPSAWRMSSVNSRARPPPSTFDWYMARLASRSRSAGPHLARRADGDADAGAQHDLVARHVDRLGEPLADRLGGGHRRRLVGELVQQHGELVAAEPRQGVAGARAPPAAGRARVTRRSGRRSNGRGSRSRP